MKDLLAHRVAGTLITAFLAIGCGGVQTPTDDNSTTSPTPSQTQTPAPSPTPDPAVALGWVCTATQACPTGYSCYNLDTDTSSGFCSLECPTNDAAGDQFCTSKYDYSVMSSPACTLQNPNTGANVCGLVCGDDAGNTDPSVYGCPDPMTCGDLNGNGFKDLCLN